MLLGKLIAQDRILQMMHNVALSLHLLNERYAAEESFWKPYIGPLYNQISWCMHAAMIVVNDVG